MLDRVSRSSLPHLDCIGCLAAHRAFGRQAQAPLIARRIHEPGPVHPQVRFLTYGKQKDGYWTYDHFAEQTSDILDMYEYLYPNAQVAIEVDWSSGHAKHRADALNVNAMRVNMGGDQPVPHASQVSAGCLGEGAQLQVGQLQYFYYRSAEERGDRKPDPPPFYLPATFAPERYVGQAKGKKQVLWERGLWKDGMIEKVDDDDPKGRDQVRLSPAPTSLSS